MTMVMCDNDRCRFNNDRVCAREKIYCVGRSCRCARKESYIDMMRRPSYPAKLRDRNPNGR